MEKRKKLTSPITEMEIDSLHKPWSGVMFAIFEVEDDHRACLVTCEFLNQSKQ